MANITFSKEEISHIEKNLGFIVFDWAKHLVGHIIGQARDAGVDTVYINTPETLAKNAPISNETKAEYFYEKIPQALGFKKEQVNLGRGSETFWAYHLNVTNASIIKELLTKFAKKITLEEIPRKYQGAFINIIGLQDYYTEEEIKHVLSMLESKKQKPKSQAKYFYDWESTKWTGGQRFRNDISENVVLQRVTAEVQNLIRNDPMLLKFWAFMLSQSQHFGNDVMGFALISKINKKRWLINEIQTDCINAYLNIRRLDKETKEKTEGVSWEVLKDMLEAQNRKNWVPILETNEAVREQVMRNPNMIAQLPDDTQDINKWMEEQRGEMQGVQGIPGLIEHFQSVNFNTRIFRL